MIQLRPDCLMFALEDGESVPCSAESVTIELLGEGLSDIDPAVVREAAAAVVYYFKADQGRDLVSVREFAEALEKVLQNLGYEIAACNEHAREEEGVDLREIACTAGKGFELVFFQNLRDELQSRLKNAPEGDQQVIRFVGLRGCVKQLVGAQRWSRRCESLSDQIVDYLRTCLQSSPSGSHRGLVVT